MRIAICGFFHESNTFCRPYTTLADYERTRLYRGPEMVAPLNVTSANIVTSCSPVMLLSGGRSLAWCRTRW